jgi:hypothetical protein
MNTVLLFNGLGNQMSQYAFYLSKKKINPDIKCLYFASKYDDQHNGFELNRIFNIRIYKGFKYYVYFYIYCIYSNRDRKGFIGKLNRKISKYLNINVIYEKSYAFDSELLLKKTSGISYFWGGWHNEKYFNEINSDISRIFSFKISNSDTRILNLQREICSKISVSIHIRRGDYLNNNIAYIFGGICDLEYYKRAIDFIKLKTDNPYFYIFSDDKNWVKENFSMPNSEIVDFNYGEDSWKDMYLMSLCKHNINANSTFSWWAAWLNKNNNKIVIVPEIFNSKGESDIYPESWIKIPISKIV